MEGGRALPLGIHLAECGVDTVLLFGNRVTRFDLFIRFTPYCSRVRDSRDSCSLSIKFALPLSNLPAISLSLIGERVCRRWRVVQRHMIPLSSLFAIVFISRSVSRKHLSIHFSHFSPIDRGRGLRQIIPISSKRTQNISKGSPQHSYSRSPLIKYEVQAGCNKLPPSIFIDSIRPRTIPTCCKH